MRDIIRSKQFGYASIMAVGGELIVILGAVGAWIGTKQSVAVLVSALCVGTMPVIKRVMEGVSDANRAAAGESIPSDVK
jgi:hypothetical protein